MLVTGGRMLVTGGRMLVTGGLTNPPGIRDDRSRKASPELLLLGGFGTNLPSDP